MQSSGYAENVAASSCSSATTEAAFGRDCLESTRQVIQNCRAQYEATGVLRMNTVILTCNLVALPVTQYARVMSALEDIMVTDTHMDIRLGQDTSSIRVSDNDAKVHLVQVCVLLLRRRIHEV